MRRCVHSIFTGVLIVSVELRVRDIEIKTRVPKKFRFPLFQRYRVVSPVVLEHWLTRVARRMCWYVGEAYNRALKAKEDIPTRILSELRSLSEFLVSEARLIEGSAAPSTTSDSTRKEARDMVPVDKVHDAPALARELRWRLKAVLDGGSGEETAKPKLMGNGAPPPRSKHSTPTASSANGSKKRKREVREGSEGSTQSIGMFRNFTPRPWDTVSRTDGELSRAARVKLPQEWGVGSDGRDGDLETRTDRMVKVRRTDGVVEREVITRVKEVWKVAGDPNVMQM